MITTFWFVDCFVVVWHKTRFWFLLFPMDMCSRFFLFHSCFNLLGRYGGFLDSGVSTDSGMLLVFFVCMVKLLGDITCFLQLN